MERRIADLACISQFVLRGLIHHVRNHLTSSSRLIKASWLSFEVGIFTIGQTLLWLDFRRIMNRNGSIIHLTRTICIFIHIFNSTYFEYWLSDEIGFPDFSSSLSDKTFFDPDIDLSESWSSFLLALFSDILKFLAVYFN